MGRFLVITDGNFQSIGERKSTKYVGEVEGGSLGKLAISFMEDLGILTASVRINRI